MGGQKPLSNMMGSAVRYSVFFSSLKSISESKLTLHRSVADGRRQRLERREPVGQPREWRVVFEGTRRRIKHHGDPFRWPNLVGALDRRADATDWPLATNMKSTRRHR